MSLLELICFTSNSSWSRMYSLKKPTLDTSKQRINEVKKTSLESLELCETLHLDQAKELDLPEEHPLGNNISPAHIFTVRASKSHGTSNEKNCHGTSCGQTFPSRCTGCIHTIARLVVEPTPLKNMLVKLGSSSPKFGMNIKKYLSCHHVSPQNHPLKIGFSIIFTIHFGGFPPIFWKHP